MSVTPTPDGEQPRRKSGCLLLFLAVMLVTAAILAIAALWPKPQQAVPAAAVPTGTDTATAAAPTPSATATLSPTLPAVVVLAVPTVTPIPTATAPPTPTPLPTATLPPTATSAPTPTPTPTLRPEVTSYAQALARNMNMLDDALWQVSGLLQRAKVDDPAWRAALAAEFGTLHAVHNNLELLVMPEGMTEVQAAAVGASQDCEDATAAAQRGIESSSAADMGRAADLLSSCYQKIVASQSLLAAYGATVDLAAPLPSAEAGAGSEQSLPTMPPLPPAP